MKVGKGAARPPEKFSAEEMEERRQKRREEQLGTKSDVSPKRAKETSLTLSHNAKFKVAVLTEFDTSDDKAVVCPKRAQGESQLPKAEEGRSQAERDREEKAFQEAHK